MTVAELPSFHTLVDAHGDELLAHARRLTDTDRAEDVVQEALLRALRGYAQLRHAEQLRAWLYRIVTNVAIDQHRRARREVPSPDPAVHVTADPEQMDGFEDLIAGLTEPVRATLRLRFVEDLEYDAIAARLDCTPPAARRRVSDALQTLRERNAA